jgi:fructokinase
VTFSIGLDIGGTKIGGAVYGEDRKEIMQIVRPTPANYSDLVTTCRDMIWKLDQACEARASVGVGVPGAFDHKTGDVLFTGNTPCIVGQPLRRDLEKIVDRPVRLANDADCAALSEAVDGAGAEHNIVFGIILGTGVGGGLVINRQIVSGPNGLTGEFGHIVVPFREESDGPTVDCVCRQKGCIDKSVSGLALARLYAAMTGKQANAGRIADLARENDAEALRVLDRFYTTVAKAMVTIIHMFDPDIIVVSGGLSNHPRLYDEVPKRWGSYTVCKEPKTLFVPAKFGALSGLRGAAWVGAG